MSVIVATKLSGDTNVFTKSLSDRAEEYRQIAERSRERGGLHHQFAVGDGFVFIIDEWESAQAFQSFFSDPELQTFIASAGGDPNVPPEVTIGEAIDSPDKY